MAKKKAKKAAKRAPKKSGSKGKAKAKAKGKKKSVDLIISKSRTKAAADLNVSGEFYSALDSVVRDMIAGAEARATNNGRRTLRPHDL